MKITHLLLLLFVITTSITIGLVNENISLRNDITRHKNNIKVINKKKDAYRISVDSMKIETTSLVLKNNELSIYKEEAEELIKELGFKVKNLQSMSRTKATVYIPIHTKLEKRYHPPDSLGYIPLPDTYKFSYSDKYLKASGVIIADSITIDVKTSVILNQVVKPIPKHKFLWIKWGVKGFTQTVWVDNPYVKLEYSEHFIFH